MSISKMAWSADMKFFEVIHVCLRNKIWLFWDTEQKSRILWRGRIFYVSVFILEL